MQTDKARQIIVVIGAAFVLTLCPSAHRAHARPCYTNPVAKARGINGETVLCIAVGQSVSLTAVYSGAYSYDPDNGTPSPGRGISLFEWFVDGQWDCGQTISHQFNRAGEEEVLLKVWDDEQPPYQAIATDAITVWVVAVNVDAGLSEEEEENPGLYVPVNWSDDDGDGWEPNEDPPNGTYKGDKDDDFIGGGADNDFRPFYVGVNPNNAPVAVVLEFENNIEVWETWDKKKGVGEDWVSSEVPSGTSYDPQDIPWQLLIEGQSGTQDFRDVSLTATVKYGQNEICSDTVKVTVFEVVLGGLFDGPQQADCDVKMSDATLWEDLLSSDRKGKISWDDADGNGVVGDNDPNCEYFHDCMECQGTVKPCGVTTQAQFTFERDTWCRSWVKVAGEGFWTLVKADIPWQDDDWPDDADEDNTPSAQNHIYQIDGPGHGMKSQFTDFGQYTHWAHIMDLRQRVLVSFGGGWRQCSDFYKWHSQIYLKPKNATELTRDAPALQNLGGGWIAVPDNP